jgi:hypothetical protein
MKSKPHDRRGWMNLVCITTLLLALLAPGLAQQSQKQPQPVQPDYSGQPPLGRSESEWEIEQREKMAKQANLQRHTDLRKDTEKLLELATELKQEVDKSNENTLSLTVIKKAEQIEKLAKSVKEKMKGM